MPHTRKPRACAVCTNDYRPTYREQRTCGRACGVVLRRREHGHAGRPKLERWPSSKVYILDCAHCGEPYAARTRARQCCRREDCVKRRKAASWARDKRRNRPKASRNCEACGQAFSTGKSRQRFCSEICEKRTTRRSRRHYRERARRAGVEYEPVHKALVFERDRWRCGLCRTKVDPELRYPHPMSASLDHILPMALGGGHTYANVHLTHLRCNLDKGVDGRWEQLALIG